MNRKAFHDNQALARAVASLLKRPDLRKSERLYLEAQKAGLAQERRRILTADLPGWTHAPKASHAYSREGVNDARKLDLSNQLREELSTVTF